MQFLLVGEQGPFSRLGKGEDVAFFDRGGPCRVEELTAAEPGETDDIAAAGHGLGGRHAEPLPLAEAQKDRAGPQRLSGFALGAAVDIDDLPGIEAAACAQEVHQFRASGCSPMPRHYSDPPSGWGLRRTEYVAVYDVANPLHAQFRERIAQVVGTVMRHDEDSLDSGNTPIRRTRRNRTDTDEGNVSPLVEDHDARPHWQIMQVRAVELRDDQ